MEKHLTIGFPRMKKEHGELRVFLPEFIQWLAGLGMKIFIEEGYGSKSGFTFENFQCDSELVQMCDRETAFAQEMVIVLRSPTREEFQMIPPDTVLISMLHYPTRSVRVEILQRQGIKAISLDSIISDQGLRLVENMKAVAWNGLEAAFDLLEQRWPDCIRPDGEPIRVLVCGTGMVGKHAVDAGSKLGNIERNNQHIEDGGPGAIVETIGRNITCNPATMQRLMRRADVLVDASYRRDPSLPLIPNSWIGCLPEHAVICDLSVDPYTMDADPPVVRGVEGIPQGNLIKYIFHPLDREWMDTIPPGIPTDCRRDTVTCYSWPGIHPEACMRHYAQQLQPLLEALLGTNYDELSLEGNYFERALYRGTLKSWLCREDPLHCH